MLAALQQLHLWVTLKCEDLKFFKFLWVNKCAGWPLVHIMLLKRHKLIIVQLSFSH